MRTLVFSALLLSAVTVPVLAQNATPATPPQFVSVSQSSVLSSNLVGLDVTNAGGQTVGEIKDVVLTADKNIGGIIVSVGGFLGMGEHYVVVDPATISISYDSGNKKWLAQMNVTADQLKAAPAFTYDDKWKS